MQLTFCCELPEADLLALFEDDTLIPTLQHMNAAISLGLMDLSDGRAEIVRRLNDAGIPVIAWLLLPMAQGYWFNINNAPEAHNRYNDFKAWTKKHALTWKAIGLDIEFDRREVDALIEDPSQISSTLLNKLFDRHQLEEATGAYRYLVAQMRADGYTTESYHLPFILDERRVGSTLLGKVVGLVDIPTDREVLMLYSSFLGGLGAGALWSYASEAECIAVGSTGGGVDMGAARDMVLSWDALARDLRLAARHTDQIYIFSLEGCIAQGFLPHLVDFDWSASVTIPEREARQFRFIRRTLRGVLWASAHPLQIMIGAGAIATLLRSQRKRLS